MENAHLRFAQVEFNMDRKKSSTSVRVYCDMFAAHKTEGLVLSVFGNETEMSAIAGAVGVGYSLEALLPDGTKQMFNMGQKATNSRAFITIPGQRRAYRHTIFFSESVTHNGQDGKVLCLQDDPTMLWASIASFLGLPALPEWGPAANMWLRKEKKLTVLDGFNCSPVLVTATREEMLEWIGSQVKAKKLNFPEANTTIVWPNYTVKDLRARASSLAAA